MRLQFFGRDDIRINFSAEWDDRLGALPD